MFLEITHRIELDVEQTLGTLWTLEILNAGKETGDGISLERQAGHIVPRERVSAARLVTNWDCL